MGIELERALLYLLGSRFAVALLGVERVALDFHHFKTTNQWKVDDTSGELKFQGLTLCRPLPINRALAALGALAARARSAGVVSRVFTVAEGAAKDVGQEMECGTKHRIIYIYAKGKRRRVGLAVSQRVSSSRPLTAPTLRHQRLPGSYGPLDPLAAKQSSPNISSITSSHTGSLRQRTVVVYCSAGLVAHAKPLALDGHKIMHNGEDACLLNPPARHS
jgi:hypothetical protein